MLERNDDVDEGDLDEEQFDQEAADEREDAAEAES